MEPVNRFCMALKSAWAAVSPPPATPSIQVKIIQRQKWDKVAHAKFKAAVLKAKEQGAEQQVFKKHTGKK